jgi:hypothetical protein
MDSSFLLVDWLGQPLWMWLMFIAIVIALLVFDLGVLHKENREIEVKESLVLSAGYIAMGVGFGAWIWWYLGPQRGVEYLTGFIVEKTLAMDNVFVIAMIFTYFAVPRIYQHRVLFWGILGVIVLRAIMIGLGAAHRRELLVGSLHLRDLPDPHGREDDVVRRPEAGPVAEPCARLHPSPVQRDGPACTTKSSS